MGHSQLMKYLNSLNQKQRDAVEVLDGPVLILAGAGSGKTRVLTRRIAHLIFQRRADPSEIFAVTFTNKAAAEMRQRVFELLSDFPGYEPGNRFNDGIWVTTFHSACVRILRSDIHHIGYNNQFTIYDDSDQLSVIKACMKELNVSDQMISPKSIQGRINKIKNEGEDHLTYRSNYGGPMEDAFLKVYTRYAEVLKASSALDFADLILMTVRLFEKVPQVLENYRKRFRYLLIDEYQDTNRSQYLLMKMLAGTTANICAVGDEDQSIYRWRGADITNILNFEKDFSNAKIFKLEENYRSTKNIIEAASCVIANNTERRDKQLWTQNSEGEIIQVIEAYDEHDESYKVSAEIARAIADDYPLNQIAIFYRTNAQSRLIEDMLRAKGVNYQVYGGLKFYDRLEVKDTLAYMKLISNPRDDVSFRRIINVPGRGIGAVSLERFSQAANQRSMGHYQLLEAIFGREVSETSVDLGRSRKNFKNFFDLMESFRETKQRCLPSDLVNVILEESGYRKSLSDEQTVESQSRIENLAELRQSIVEYELRCGAERPDQPITLEGFLEEIALVSDSDRFDPQAPALKMMTIHMAKGLEFDVVLIVGLEEELFPNIRPWEMEETASLEEERRLFYVGMTRARKRLQLFYSKNRTVFGTTHFRVMSRFVEEMPEKYRDFKKADYFSRRRHYLERPGLPQTRPQENYDDFNQAMSEIDTSVEYADDVYVDHDTDLRKGSHVIHPTFGEGVVRELLGGDKLMVEFPGRGVKKISTKFAQLKPG
jgi:DNA helicase II / ATP-dependent DNA helicase PcrA